MKKIIEIDDELYARLEKIQNDYHIKTVAPVISLILTLGIKWFEKLNDVSPTMNIPTPIPFPLPYQPWQPTEPYTPWYPWYPWYNEEPYKWEVWCNGSAVNVTGYGDYTIGDWQISSNMSGASFNYVGQ